MGANQLHYRTSTHIESVAGVMVSIAAFQAVDPGSIPGPRIFWFCRIAVLAEWLRRMLKAHVRKSVGSIPTDCIIFVLVLGTRKKSRQGGSNPRSTAYEAVALPLGHTGLTNKKRIGAEV